MGVLSQRGGDPKKITMKITKRMLDFIEFAQQLDPRVRHRVTVVFRGREPWDVEEHVTQQKLGLKSKTKGK